MSTADDDEKLSPARRRDARCWPTTSSTGLDAERRHGRADIDPLQPGHTLPAGTRLRDYEITGLIGEGGFGIVYLAWDHSLQRKVAIKEYMPASMAARVAGSSAIVVKSERHLDTFKAGLQQFHQRSAAARALRPPLPRQGLPLLGSERHGLHGDAATTKADTLKSRSWPKLGHVPTKPGSSASG